MYILIIIYLFLKMFRYWKNKAIILINKTIITSEFHCLEFHCALEGLMLNLVECDGKIGSCISAK